MNLNRADIVRFYDARRSDIVYNSPRICPIFIDRLVENSIKKIKKKTISEYIRFMTINKTNRNEIHIRNVYDRLWRI